MYVYIQIANKMGFQIKLLVLIVETIVNSENKQARTSDPVKADSRFSCKSMQYL
jgi:hypothetical protein